MHYPSYLKNLIIIGHTTSKSCKVWIRLENANQDKDYILKVLQNDNLIQEKNFKINSKSSDNIAVVKISNLAPNTKFQCLVYDKDNNALYGANLGEKTSFKTLSTSINDSNFAVLSCNQPFSYNKKGIKSINASTWNKVKEQNPEFIIHLGDQIYSDAVKEHNNIFKEAKVGSNLLESYRNFYKANWDIPEIRKVLSNFPNYMTLDDHDIFDGYGSYTHEEKRKYAKDKLNKSPEIFDDIFGAAKKAYQEYQHSHNPDTNKNIFDYSLSNNSGDFYFFDLRTNRDINNEDDKYKILGQVQHGRFDKWVEKQKKSNSKLPIFIVSGVPFVHLKTIISEILINFKSLKDDIRDHWGLDLHEIEFNKILNQLFSLSESTKRPIIVLSGDVHMSAIFDIYSEKHPNAKIHQVTSSAITNTNPFLLRHAMKMFSTKKGKLCSDKNYSYKQVTNYTHKNFVTINTKFNTEKDESLSSLTIKIISDRGEVRRLVI
jgi:alkaline phosphatase D